MKRAGGREAFLVLLLLAGCSGPASPATGPETADPGVATPAADHDDAIRPAGASGPGPADSALDPAGLPADAAAALADAAPPPALPAGVLAAAGRNDVVTLDVAGRARTAIVHVPPGMAAGQDAPLLVMLHPAMTSGALVQRFYGMDAQADARGFIVAYPDGTPEPADAAMHTWNAGYCCGEGRDSGSADVSFVAALIERLVQDYPVDAGHVGLAGHSNGGMLAHRVAAERSDLVSSVMVVAGSVGGQESKGQPELRAPAPAAPVSALVVHAVDDSVVAYAGGNPSGPFEPRRIDLPVRDAVDLWLAAAGLAGQAPSVTTAGVVVREAWGGGSSAGGGPEVVFVTTEGGHGWPGVPGGQPPFFRSPVEPAATPLVADFFLAHPR